LTARPAQQVLVSDPKSPVFANIPNELLITSPTPAYRKGLTELLADELASEGPEMASAIAFRVEQQIQSSKDANDRLAYRDVACRLMANAAAKNVQIHQVLMDQFSRMLRKKKIEC